MAKADLQAAQLSYDKEMSLARRALADHRYFEAVRRAVAAWDFVEDMMKYERRWEEAEFKSVACIDLVLLYAPLLLDDPTLIRLQRLLKERRTIDKYASDDLAARLADARAILRTAHRLWHHLELNPDARRDTLGQHLGGEQQSWHRLLDQWISMGLVDQTKHEDGISVRLSTCMTYRARAKCSACGAVANGPKRVFLDQRQCPRCQESVLFVLLPDLESSLPEKMIC